MTSVQILVGDALTRLRELPDESVQTCVTSPPYWGLRDYGMAEQLGAEPTPDLYVAHLVEVFREVRRVLRDDGTVWLNLGDTYAGSNAGSGTVAPSDKQASNAGSLDLMVRKPMPLPMGLKAKDLVGIPWRVAFALQEDGWYLRSDIIWSKPNPMPESVTDRPTRSHEYLFLLAKSARYYYDGDAIREPLAASTLADPRHETGRHTSNGKWANMVQVHAGGRNNGLDHPKTPEMRKKQDALGKPTYAGFNARWAASEHRPSWYRGKVFMDNAAGRNCRDVWTLAPAQFREAHFATFPEKLVEPCLKAGCPEGGVVLDPFGGAGTTGLVAARLGRSAILIELNLAYADMARHRIESAVGLLTAVTVDGLPEAVAV